jgi:hypothetical protein
MSSLTGFGRTLLCIAMLFGCTTVTWSKHKDDVVVMKNGDRITGEIKSLQYGELIFKASYMEDSVHLDWAEVARLESKDSYLISMVDGYQFREQFRLEERGSENFHIGPSGVIRVTQKDVVRILPIEANFWSQLEGSIDLGLNYTSGNDQYNVNFASTAIYRWTDSLLTASFDTSFSGQTNGTKTARNEVTLDYRKQLSQRWFAGALFDTLHSDQQSLDLRVTAGGLIGRNLIMSDRTRFSAFGGLGVNREKYSVAPAQEWKTNVDAIGGVDFTTFRFSSTNITSRLTVFPSLNTPGRVRTQLKSDLNIKIAKDFWWGLHVYENFDSKPPIRADKNDLGISTSIGWKF